MATPDRPTATRTRPPGQPPAGGKRPPWLWIGLAVVVLALAVVAVAGSRDSDSATKAKEAGLEQTRPVQVSGAPLPKFTDNSDDPAMGQTAPALRGASFDGTPVAITHGRPKLVLFVAHWCPHCQREVPLIVKHLSSHPLPEGVDLVTVATSTAANRPNYPPSAWLERVGWKAPTLADSSDGTAADAFGLSSFPYFVALDSAGKVVARTSGEMPIDQFDLLVERARG
jgi:cytochrome c biogenesis protein CcmG, thiol:disulfide interchange protein DsbE